MRLSLRSQGVAARCKRRETFAFAADEIGSALPSGQSGYPEFPDEKPTKAKLKEWLDTWGDYMIGYRYMRPSARESAKRMLVSLKSRNP